MRPRDSSEGATGSSGVRIYPYIYFWPQKANRMPEVCQIMIELNELIAVLNKLSRNLWWCWDQEAQDFFTS
jgi:hypothetical protein